jgi:hypothetical protein
MRTEEPINIGKEKEEKEVAKKEEEEEEDIDDIVLLGYPKKNYEKLVFFLPFLAVLLSIASFFINNVIPDNRCPPHLNDVEYRNSVRFMSRLQQTFHRGESTEEVFDDLAIILNKLENEDFKKAFLEKAWNASFVKTLLKIAAKSAHACKKKKSITLLLYALQTIRQIFDFGVSQNNEKACTKSLEKYTAMFDVAHKCNDDELVLSTVFQTMTTSLFLPCSEGIYTKHIQKVISFAEEGQFGGVEKMIIAFLTIYSDTTKNIYAEKENINAICEIAKNSVQYATSASGDDAGRLCYLINKFNCTGIPELLYRRLLRSDACRKYR